MSNQLSNQVITNQNEEFDLGKIKTSLKNRIAYHMTYIL
jgi:hypothetical protein